MRAARHDNVFELQPPSELATLMLTIANGAPPNDSQMQMHMNSANVYVKKLLDRGSKINPKFQIVVEPLVESLKTARDAFDLALAATKEEDFSERERMLKEMHAANPQMALIARRYIYKLTTGQQNNNSRARKTLASLLATLREYQKKHPDSSND